MFFFKYFFYLIIIIIINIKKMRIIKKLKEYNDYIPKIN